MTSTQDDFTSFRFTTRGLPPAQRLSRWQEGFDRPPWRRVLSPLRRSDEPFHVEMTGHTLGGSNDSDASQCTSIRRMMVTAGGTAHRTRELLADGNDDVVLHLHQSGRCIVSQLGREAETGGGLLTSNADKSTIVLPQAARFVSIAIPRRLMLALAPGVEDAFMRPLPPDSGVLRLLMRYLAILDDEEALTTPELRHAFATHVHDLCALAIGAARDTAELARRRGLRAARLNAVKADIARNLDSDEVTATALAMRQRVTPRYIHKLFEGEGVTLSQFVRGQRLARVHRALTDPGAAHRTIGELAFDAGFGDLSTFNRYFRGHFGMTPSDVRAATIRTER